MKIGKSISLFAVTGRTELAGAIDGSAWYQDARSQLDTVDDGAFVLDFNGIRIATVSWLREGVIALVKYAAAIKPDVVVVVANLSDLVREELQVALEATGTVVIEAAIGSSSQLVSPTLLGRLDQALSETLAAVAGEQTFDAPFVCKALPHVGASAANNRLASLEGKNILRSHRTGRSRIYRPVLKGLRYGN